MSLFSHVECGLHSEEVKQVSGEEDQNEKLPSRGTLKERCCENQVLLSPERYEVRNIVPVRQKDHFSGSTCSVLAKRKLFLINLFSCRNYDKWAADVCFYEACI